MRIDSVNCRIVKCLEKFIFLKGIEIIQKVLKYLYWSSIHTKFKFVNSTEY